MTPTEAYQTVDLFNIEHRKFSIVMTQELAQKILDTLPNSTPHPYTHFMGHKLYISYTDQDLIYKLEYARKHNELILFLS
jgi:hypothetical protein